MEGQPAKVRKMYRQANIRPLVEAFFAWTKEIQSKNQLSRGKTLDGANASAIIYSITETAKANNLNPFR